MKYQDQITLYCKGAGEWQVVAGGVLLEPMPGIVLCRLVVRQSVCKLHTTHCCGENTPHWTAEYCFVHCGWQCTPCKAQYRAFQVACNWAMSCRSSHVIKLKLSSQLIGQFGHVTASASCKQPEKHGTGFCILCNEEFEKLNHLALY